VSVGVCTSGVSCIGIFVAATKPNSEISNTPTTILTGFLTKKSMSCMGRHARVVILRGEGVE
jgi:hypothetical protein